MKYQIGTYVFRDWKITRQLGEGGYGVVFEIQKNNFGITTTSALKVLQVPKSQSDVKAAYSEGMDERSVTSYFQECVHRLVSEIAILSGLKSHPHIVGYEDHDVIQRTDEFGWDILLRMELLTPLADHYREHPPTEEDVIQLAKQMCLALSFCHKKNLVHRDIKPANIFVNELGQYKLGDFGVSRTMAAAASNMSKAGTEGYMAPEVYYGRPYNPNVDLYSLGLVLYQLVNSYRLPFQPLPPQPITFSNRESAMMRRMTGEALPDPAGASQAFAAVIRKACAYDPAQRYQTADEMLEALENMNKMTKKEEPYTARDGSLWDLPHDHNRNSWESNLEALDDDDNDTSGSFGSFGSVESSGSSGNFGMKDITDEFTDKTESTISAFGSRPPQKKTPPQTGKVITQKTPFGTIRHTVGDVDPNNPVDQLFGQFFGGGGKQAAPVPSTAGSQQRNPAGTTPRPGNNTPTVYFDRQPTGLNLEIARKNRIPGQAEIWVTANLMNGIVQGSFPNISLPFYFSNGICWKFSGNTLKGYMTALQNVVKQGLHTVTLINRFPQLPGLQETIYLHLQSSKPGDAPIAYYDGVSNQVFRLGASGRWITDQNIMTGFTQDGACNNPFYQLSSFLHQAPKRVWITSALAQTSVSVMISGPGEPKKVMAWPALPNGLSPSILGTMTEEIAPGQPVDVAEFFLLEKIVPSNKLAVWLPDDGLIYTAMFKSAAKQGSFAVTTKNEKRYNSLRDSIFF